MRTVNDWFELTYAGWLTIPRVLLQAMSEEWQRRFVECLDEMDEEFESMGCDGLEIEVRFKKDGKYVKTSDHVCDYRHPHQEWLDSLRTKK